MLNFDFLLRFTFFFFVSGFFEYTPIDHIFNDSSMARPPGWREVALLSPAGQLVEDFMRQHLSSMPLAIAGFNAARVPDSRFNLFLYPCGAGKTAIIVALLCVFLLDTTAPVGCAPPLALVFVPTVTLAKALNECYAVREAFSLLLQRHGKAIQHEVWAHGEHSNAPPAPGTNLIFLCIESAGSNLFRQETLGILFLTIYSCPLK